jgi:hypothetical protein
MFRPLPRRSGSGYRSRMKYLLLKTDGTIETLHRNSPLELADLQDLVGGYIEHVLISNGLSALMNEEGRLMGLPQNPFLPAHVGNIVIGRNENSEFVGLHDDEIATFH